MAIFPVHTEREPTAAMQALLSLRPATWTDDGLTMFPDSILGWSIAIAGTMHDMRYCTRLWVPGSMTTEAKAAADSHIRDDVMYCLPWGLKWTGLVVFLGVWRGGWGSFDSCGPGRGLCRHGVPEPGWQLTLRLAANGEMRSGVDYRRHHG